MQSDGGIPGSLSTEIGLSQAHYDAVNRRRRISVQYDAADLFGIDFDQWLDYRFNFADEEGTHIDSLWWDIGMGDCWTVYPSKLLPFYPNPGLLSWREQGIDWVGALIGECRKRNLETFWNHRISEVDVNPEGGLALERRFRLKEDHPDWVIPCWWWQGMWNLAVPEVRAHKLALLQELAETYDLDGIQIDFARHTPYLPPGAQWENRHHATEFMAMMRRMLLAVAEKRGRPFLLAAKVPENLEGCRMDGLDVEAWAQGKLVDIFTLGSRSMTVDIAAFRRITQGHNIKLQPCLDDHHATDGYRYPPIEFFRGVFGNWWQQGADGVATFNWSNATPEVCRQVSARPGPASQRQAYHEVGNPHSLHGKDKFFAVERRWGYPWSDGYFNHNMWAPLPTKLANDGRATDLAVRICDPLSALVDAVQAITVRAVLFGAVPEDRLGVTLNGVDLPLTAQDPAWKDPQIFAPRPQPASGGSGDYKLDPEQKLLLLTYAATPGQFKVGKNRIHVRILGRAPYPIGRDIHLEKLEVHLSYRPRTEE